MVFPSSARPLAQQDTSKAMDSAIYFCFDIPEFKVRHSFDRVALLKRFEVYRFIAEDRLDL